MVINQQFAPALDALSQYLYMPYQFSQALHQHQLNMMKQQLTLQFMSITLSNTGRTTTYWNSDWNPKLNPTTFSPQQQQQSSWCSHTSRKITLKLVSMVWGSGWQKLAKVLHGACDVIIQGMPKSESYSLCYWSADIKFVNSFAIAWIVKKISVRWQCEKVS